jgi:hypothetical protein
MRYAPRMDDAGLPALQDAIQHMYGLRSEWLESVPIREVFRGELVFEGEIQIFAVEHPKASRAYAWSHLVNEETGRRKFFVVLGMPPIGSAIDKDAPKSIVFPIRLSADERAEIAAAAQRAGLKDSEWGRRVLLAAASG